MTAAQNLELVQRFLADHSPMYMTEDVDFQDFGSGVSLQGADAIGAYLYDLYHVEHPGAVAEARHVSASPEAVTAEFTFRDDNMRLDIPMAAIYAVDNGKISGIRVYYDSRPFAGIERDAS